MNTIYNNLVHKVITFMNGGLINLLFDTTMMAQGWQKTEQERDFLIF